MADEVTAEGITQPEAVGRRVLEVLGKMIHEVSEGQVDFKTAYHTLTVVVDITLPFVDPATKTLLGDTLRQWKEEAELRAMPEFGKWA